MTKKGIDLIMQMDKMFNTDEEYWLPIEDHLHYSVSTYGNVRNNKTGRILKTGKRAGYFSAELWESNKVKKIYVHRLVAQTFISNPKNKQCVDHKDRNQLNNHINNLRFASSGKQYE
jgi:hypothetical protein